MGADICDQVTGGDRLAAAASGCVLIFFLLLLQTTEIIFLEKKSNIVFIQLSITKNLFLQNNIK